MNAAKVINNSLMNQYNSLVKRIPFRTIAFSKMVHFGNKNFEMVVAYTKCAVLRSSLFMHFYPYPSWNRDLYSRNAL